MVTVIPNGNIFNIHPNQLDSKPGKHYQIYQIIFYNLQIIWLLLSIDLDT